MSGFLTVTETPEAGATKEQLSMFYTRYHLAGKLAEGKDLLEVACGSGIGLGYLATKAKHVVAGDFDPNILAIARDHYDGRIELKQMDAGNLPFPAGSFDVVVLLEAIYYLSDAKKFIDEAGRVLRPGGALYICSANKEWRSFNPSPFSVQYYSAEELTRLLKNAGFAVQAFVGHPDSGRGPLDMIRRIAVRFHLVPKTMKGKEVLKRVLFGKLPKLPRELKAEDVVPAALSLLEEAGPVTSFKVLHMIGTMQR